MYPYEPYSGTHPAPYWLRDDCHAKHYREPDMNSFSCDDQLPLISSIGRGPRGAGITAKLLKDTDTEYVFSIVDDVTGEQVFQSPNLAPTIVSVTTPNHKPVPGEVYPITFHMRRGTDISDYTVEMPPGATGSLIYCLEDPIKFKVPPDEWTDKSQVETNMWTEFGKLYDETFVTTVDHLLIYGRSDWKGKPFPRVNDIIFCPYYAEKQDGYSIGVSFGTIEAVENGTVVWTARTFVPSSDIELSENGTWIINGKDSGFVAKGEKGDKGERGETGKAPEMQIGHVYNSSTASADVRLVNEELNRYAIDLGLPRGASGGAEVTKIIKSDDYDNRITIDSSIRFITGDFYCYIINYHVISTSMPSSVSWKMKDINGNFILLKTDKTSNLFQTFEPISPDTGVWDYRTIMGFLPRAKSAQAALASLLPVQDECEQMEAEVAKLEQDWIDNTDETVAVDGNGVPITIATKKTELEKKKAELEKLREDYFSKLGDWKNEV